MTEQVLVLKRDAVGGGFYFLGVRETDASVLVDLRAAAAQWSLSGSTKAEKLPEWKKLIPGVMR